MNIVVTGGLGFIGSHVVDLLQATEHNITVIDNKSSPNIWYPDSSKSQGYYDVMFADVTKYDELLNAFLSIEETLQEPIDIVCHLAAQLEITASQANPLQDLMTNAGGTANVLRAMEFCNIPRIVNASSACVYGSRKYTTELKQPNWPYGVSKLAAEEYVNMWVRNSGLDHPRSATNIRYGIVFGPREWYGRVLTRFLLRAKEGKSLIVFGDGDQIRDFVPVELAAKQTVQEIFRTPANTIGWGSPYTYTSTIDCGTGIKTSVFELAKIVSKITKAPILFEDVEEGDKDSEGRTRIPNELKSMVLNNTTTDPHWPYSKQDLIQDIEKMWEWVKTTDLSERWKIERV